MTTELERIEADALMLPVEERERLVERRLAWILSGKRPSHFLDLLPPRR